MKVPSEVGRNWWSSMLVAAERRVAWGRARSWLSFSAAGREMGMRRASRSWLNCVWAVAGPLGWTAGLLDQMQARFMMEFSRGR